MAEEDPDNDVHTQSNIYASAGDFFLNLETQDLFFCSQGGVENQLWHEQADTEQVEALINAIPQADWDEAVISAKDYIKNKPILATVATTGSYIDLSNKPTIPAAQVNSDWNAVSGLAQILNKPAAASQSSVTRTLNTIFQPSATGNTFGFYSVDIACVFSLAGGQSGTVFLEISPSSTFSSDVQELCRFTNQNTGTLVVGITLNQTQTACLGGEIPAGYYARLRTQNNTSTPTFTYRSGQEVLI